MKGKSRVAERLIGRGEELASFHRAPAEVESGHPRVIVLSGEPGIGKTRLLAELERLAEARGHLVFTGRASELERDLPYWLFVDALDEQLRSLDPDRRQRIDQRLGGELARILPAMAGFDDAAGAVLDERYRAQVDRRRHDVRVMMMIKGDREPGHLPSGEFLAQMGKYNEELSKAGVLLDLAALHWSAEGVRVKFSAGKRTVIDGPFGEAKAIVAGYWILQVTSMEEAIEWAKRLPFEAGGEPEAEGEIELRQLFELEEFGESPAVE
jgi:hypothetical protein